MSEMEDTDLEPEPQNQETQETQGSSTSLKKRTATIYNFFTFNEVTKKWKCNYCT
jgi:hypothetical protein